MVPLPPEIMDFIIASTHDEMSATWVNEWALKSCSLVCRSWRPPAQKRLFKDVWLNVNTQDPDDFLAFLLSSPHLAAAIRNLCLFWGELRWFEVLEDDADIGEKSEDDEDDKPENCPLSPVLLMEIAAALSPMAVVQLEDIALLGWPSDTPLPTAPVKLRGLELSGVIYTPEPFSLRSRTTAFDISSLFELDTIFFSKRRMAEPIHSAVSSDVPLVLTATTRPVARTVQIKGTDCFAAFNLQCGGFDPGRLETLRFSLTDSATLRFAGALLRIHENSVHNVAVAVSVNYVTATHERPEVASESLPSLRGSCHYSC